MPNQFPKQCSCGKSYTRQQWDALPGGERWHLPWGEVQEQRHCPCESTMSIVITPEPAHPTVYLAHPNSIEPVEVTEDPTSFSVKRGHFTEYVTVRGAGGDEWPVLRSSLFSDPAAAAIESDRLVRVER